MRRLGAVAAVTLQAKKVNDVEVVASSGVDKDLLGTFYNSFTLSNYEFTTKTAPAEAGKKDKNEDVRVKKHTKHIENFELSH